MCIYSVCIKNQCNIFTTKHLCTWNVDSIPKMTDMPTDIHVENKCLTQYINQIFFVKRQCCSNPGPDLHFTINLLEHRQAILKQMCVTVKWIFESYKQYIYVVQLHWICLLHIVTLGFLFNNTWAQLLCIQIYYLMRTILHLPLSLLLFHKSFLVYGIALFTVKSVTRMS